MTSSDPADLDLQYFKGLIPVQHNHAIVFLKFVAVRDAQGIQNTILPPGKSQIERVLLVVYRFF